MRSQTCFNITYHCSKWPNVSRLSPSELHHGLRASEDRSAHMRSFHPDLQVMFGIYPSDITQISQLNIGKARWSSAIIDENVVRFDICEYACYLQSVTPGIRWHVISHWTYQYVYTHLHAKPGLLGVLSLPQTSHPNFLKSSCLMRVVGGRPRVEELKMEDFRFRPAPGEYRGNCGNASEHPAHFRVVPVELFW